MDPTVLPSLTPHFDIIAECTCCDNDVQKDWQNINTVCDDNNDDNDDTEDL